MMASWPVSAPVAIVLDFHGSGPRYRVRLQQKAYLPKCEEYMRICLQTPILPPIHLDPTAAAGNIPAVTPVTRGAPRCGGGALTSTVCWSHILADRLGFNLSFTDPKYLNTKRPPESRLAIDEAASRMCTIGGHDAFLFPGATTPKAGLRPHHGVVYGESEIRQKGFAHHGRHGCANSHPQQKETAESYAIPPSFVAALGSTTYSSGFCNFLSLRSYWLTVGPVCYIRLCA